MKNRWIQMDVAKGVGILIIVFGHGWFVASSPELLYPILASFILPLFFFLSGVFFKPEQPFWQTAIHRADALLKPFFFTMLAYVVIRDLLRHQPLLADIGGVLYASVDTIPWQALWFLPHFWLATLYAWAFIRVVNLLHLPLPISCALVALQLLLGILCLDWFWQIPVSFGGHEWLLPGLPFSLEIVPISSTFFIYGYLLRGQLREHHSSFWTLLLSALIFAALFLYSHATQDLAQRRYDHWFWSSAMSVCGVYICWALSGLLMQISWLRRPINYIGQSTLILLIFHGEIQHKTFNLMEFLGLPAIAAASVALVAAVLGPLLIGEIIKRVTVLRWLYHPFLRKKHPTVTPN